MKSTAVMDILIHYSQKPNRATFTQPIILSQFLVDRYSSPAAMVRIAS